MNDIMQMHLDDRGPDLVILSACESGAPDIGSNDELIGLPVALLQAGSRGVVSSLWPVQEEATLLLMARFHELRVHDGLPASFALWNAQKWLRTATATDLFDYLNAQIGVGTLAPGTEIAKSMERMLQELDNYRKDERPYADPYFWAGFAFSGSDSSEHFQVRPDTLALSTPAQARHTQSQFRTSGCGSIVDAKSGLEWLIRTDKNVRWSEAVEWTHQLKACGKHWEMPSTSELRTLFDRQHSAGKGYFTGGRRWPAHLDPIFSSIGDGSWVWARGANLANNAPAFNFNEGLDALVSKESFYGTVRVFATSRPTSIPAISRKKAR